MWYGGLIRYNRRDGFTLERFINYKVYDVNRNVAPTGISPERWHGMNLWLQTRFDEGWEFDGNSEMYIRNLVYLE
jgi:hypothetical protein